MKTERTSRQTLTEDGYLVLPAVVPIELCRRAESVLNATMDGPCRVWAMDDDAVINDFRAWAQTFLEGQDMGLWGWETPLHVFNRRPGADAQFWHDDDQAQACYRPFGTDLPRRIFVCTYFTDTTEGHSPLKIVPDSHKGGHLEIRRELMTMREKTLSNDEHIRTTVQIAHACLWSAYPGELLLEVPAGTMIIVDERTLHANNINTGYKRRPMALWWLFKGEN